MKWFAETDVATPPLTPHVVASAMFLEILAVAIVLVFVGFVLDGWIARRWARLVGSGHVWAEMEQRLVRAATGAYFIFVASHGGVILTPDLRSGAAWIPVVQFVIALGMVWRPTCAVAGAGLLVLYGYAVAHYGMFHLTDYVFIPGLACYLASLSIGPNRITALRGSILTASLMFSVAWTGIEKFVYPEWTYSIVAVHPEIAFGMYPPFVVTVAGFVEFTLAFYVVTGRGLVRAGAAFYALIFITAMQSFGSRDVYGHLIIISILSITVLRGATPLQHCWHLKQAALIADAAWITLLYVGALLLFFGGYYALQTTVNPANPCDRSVPTMLQAQPSVKVGPTHKNSSCLGIPVES